MDKPTRYLALDVLRGMTIALMILVNNPGSWKYIYPPLRHAAWHGCTPTDLVFPFFLFVMGVSMFFSFSKYRDGLNRASLLKVGKRTLLIFAIGLFINTFPQWKTDWSTVRIMGVLQRIALVYLFASLLVLSLSRKMLIIASSLILMVYWGVLWYFGDGDPYSLTGNAVKVVDSLILTDQHLYKGFGTPFDPEGILSSLPAVVTSIFGFFAGLIINESPRKEVPARLFFGGLATTAAGWIWGLWFPLNKSLWTSSYVVYTAGLAAITLAILVYLIDIKEYKRWTGFFVVFGMNPLFIFAFAGLFMRSLHLFARITMDDGTSVPLTTWIYQNVFASWAGPMNGSLLYAVSCIVFFWLIGLILYRNKIFIKV